MQELHRSGPLFAAAAALAVCEDSWPRKAVLLVTACPLLFVLATGLERACWLATVAGLLVVALMRSKKTLVVIVIVLGVAAAFPQIRRRAGHTVDDIQNAETYARFQMWALAPEIMSQYPYGIGSENENDILEMKLGREYSHFHNNFVNIAVDLGFLGLVAWCWWMTAFAKLAYDTWRRLPSEQSFERGVCLAGLSALTVFLVTGLFSFNFGDGDTETDMIMYFLMGCVLAVRRGLSSCNSQGPETRSMMRILHVEKQMKLSGQSLRTLKEINGLIENGHQVTLACQPDSIVGQHAAQLGASLITLPMSGVRLYTSALKLRKHILRGKYDSVNAHGARSHLLSVLALLGPKPSFRHPHETQYSSFPQRCVQPHALHSLH